MSKYLVVTVATVLIIALVTYFVISNYCLGTNLSHTLTTKAPLTSTSLASSTTKYSIKSPTSLTKDTAEGGGAKSIVVSSGGGASKSVIKSSLTTSTKVTTKSRITLTSTYGRSTLRRVVRVKHYVLKYEGVTEDVLTKEFIISSEYMVYTVVKVLPVRVGDNAYVNVNAYVTDDRGNRFTMSICTTRLKDVKVPKYCLSNWLLIREGCSVKYLVRVKVVNASVKAFIQLIKVKPVGLSKWVKYSLVIKYPLKYLPVKVVNVSEDELLVLKGLGGTKDLTAFTIPNNLSTCFIHRFLSTSWRPTGFIVPMDSVAIPSRVVVWKGFSSHGKVIKGVYLEFRRPSGNTYVIFSPRKYLGNLEVVTYDLASPHRVTYLSVGESTKLPLVNHAEGVLVGVEVRKAPSYVVLEVTIEGKLLSKYWLLSADLVNKSLAVTSSTPLKYLSNSLSAKVYLPVTKEGRYVVVLNYVVPKYLGNCLVVKYLGNEPVSEGVFKVIKGWGVLKGDVVTP